MLVHGATGTSSGQTPEQRFEVAIVLFNSNEEFTMYIQWLAWCCFALFPSRSYSIVIFCGADLQTLSAAVCGGISPEA